MKVIKAIEKFHNDLADQNFIWFPFSFLRPKKNEKISILLTFKLTLAFGTYTFCFYLIRIMLFDDQLSLANSLAFLSKTYLIFFLHFNLITAFFWNRRAAHYDI